MPGIARGPQQALKTAKKKRKKDGHTLILAFGEEEEGDDPKPLG